MENPLDTIKLMILCELEIGLQSDKLNVLFSGERMFCPWVWER